MQIIPKGDRVLVKRWELAEVSEGGIALVDKGERPKQVGHVLAVGEGHSHDFPGSIQVLDGDTEMLIETRRQDPRFKVDEVVAWGVFAGTDIASMGKNIFLLREDEIIGLVVGEIKEFVDPREPVPVEGPEDPDVEGDEERDA